MARCKKCLHYEVCAKEGRLVQVDEHTWDEYNKLDDVEQFCTSYFNVDVVPKSEVERLRGQVNRLKKYDEERDVALHARLINETKADTVRKMQESLKECFNSESDFPTQTHGYIRYTVDQIAKEILEGNNNGD